MVESDTSDDKCTSETRDDERAAVTDDVMSGVTDEYVGVGDPMHSPVPVGSNHAGRVRRSSNRACKKHSEC